MEIFRLIDENAKENILIELDTEEEKKLQKDVEEANLQFIDKTPLELKVSEEGGIDYPDFILRPLPLFSHKMKSILEENGIDNIYFKPIYLVDELLDEKNLYWLAVIPFVEFFTENTNNYDISKIGKYKLFRSYRKSSYKIYITEEIKKLLENANLNGVNINKID